MNRHQHRQRIAAGFGLVGGGLGGLAGLVQLSVGSRIPSLTGAKASPVALGLLTIALSIVAVLSALLLRRDTGHTPGRRLAAATGFFVPGALCFSTVGILWYLPGVLLLAAAVYAALAGDPAHTRAIVAGAWLHLLISVLGGFEVLMAVSAHPAMTSAVGLFGGTALMAAPWPPSLRIRMALLLIGTVPFAALTWWSMASPFLAVVALAIGAGSLRRSAGDAPAVLVEPPPNTGRHEVVTS